MKWCQCLCDKFTFTSNSGSCILITWKRQLGFLGALFFNFWFMNISLFFLPFGWCPPPFDLGILCPRFFYANFQCFLLYWSFDNKPLRLLSLHTWTWTCLLLIEAFSKIVSTSTSTWVLSFNWIKEASLCSIYCFNSFDNWALAKLGSCGTKMMAYLFLDQWKHLGTL